MKRREKILALVVGLMVLAYLLDSAGVVRLLGSTLLGGRDEVDRLLDEHLSYIDSLENLEEINAQFASIEGLFDTASAEREQRYALVTELDTIARRIGQTRPEIAPPQNEAIPNIPEYQFVTVEMALRRITEREFVTFMQELERSRILVLNMQVNAALNRDELTANLRLAKIERVSAEPTPAAEGEDS